MTDSLSPAVSVLVPCRNERNHIQRCLRSILAQLQPAGGFEVIVADGMSTDGTRETLDRMARENPSLVIIDNEGCIVSTALNAAIRNARGNIIVRMDAHTDYAPDYIRQCVATLDATHADNVGGPWIAVGSGLTSEAIAAAFQSAFAAGSARGHNPQYEGIVDTVYLGCWPRGVFDRVGLFDEELVRNQDDEFNLRLTRAGGKIWQSPLIRSSYRPRGSLTALLRQYAQYGYWKVRVIRKHRIPASIRHLVPGGFVFLLIALPALAIAWRPAGWIWLGMVALYASFNIGASVHTAASKGYRLLPLLPVVFACYHLAYGYGFLRGVIDFAILRRKPRAAYTALTRPSSPVSRNGPAG